MTLSQLETARQHHGAGAFQQAAALYRQILENDAHHAEVWCLLGEACQAQGLRDEAAVAYRKNLHLDPQNAAAQNNLGIVLMEQGERDEATASYRAALMLQPDNPEVHNNLGLILMDQGHLAEAVALFCRAVSLKPDYPVAFNNLGNALDRQCKREEAIDAYREAIRLHPDYAEAHYHLALVHGAQGDHDEAIACYRHAVRLKPDYVAALNNLANTCKDQGWLDEAIAWYRQALAAKADDLPIHSNMLFSLHYHADYSPERVFDDHLHFAAQHSGLPPMVANHRAALPCSGRRLRIGYVSADFREHVMGRYSEAVIAAHDRGRFEVFCYAEVPYTDATTERIRGAADHWRALTGLSDAAAAELIFQDDIDILVDLAGHTGGNRLGVFARKPAAIQATHFGYPDTTGLTAIDYRLSDPYADPPGQTQRYHTEKLVHLPEVLWCYPPPSSPEVSTLPALQTGRFTFGSFNNLCKVTTEMIVLWSQILKLLPESRMVLLGGAGDAGDERVLAAFANQGIDADRVAMLGRHSRDDYFRLYGGVDLCLDTYPYTGCNTTADALWMGVPMVTLAGPTCVTRQGIAALVHVGLEALVAATPEEYVKTAVDWATDLPRLAGVRAELRDRMQRSPLTNVVRFTRHLEAAYLGMVQQSGTPAADLERTPTECASEALGLALASI